MIYVISDLHGYPLKKFQQLLDKAAFSQTDTLYILGDIIDRNGDGGVEMLCWLLSQSNIHLLLGNHEAMLLSVLDASGAKKTEALENYRLSGGDVTLTALTELNNNSPQTVAAVVAYLRSSQVSFAAWWAG